MKLELKHLAPYLPYGLKIQSCNIETVIGLKNNCVIVEEFSFPYPICNCKPILRPLSELTTEFINSDNFLKEFQPEFIVGNRYEWSYGFVDRLFQLHFDIYGLIEKGLAIDINTLNK